MHNALRSHYGHVNRPLWQTYDPFTARSSRNIQYRENYLISLKFKFKGEILLKPQNFSCKLRGVDNYKCVFSKLMIASIYYS